jgi:hypothetical protein|tara:strand:+ start:3668 stop:4135 length:468 start_codon:yes stop_codon:yes gene_type:complete
MTEKVEANGVVSSMSGAATAVPEDSEVGAVCTDIAARDEFDPTKHVLHEQIQAQAQRMSDVRSRFENLGADMQHIMTLLYGLQEEVKALRIGQENMTAAGKTVDDVYVRIIEVEAKVEELFDSTISTNDYDPDEWVRESDIGDRVRELRFNVEVE